MNATKMADGVYRMGVNITEPDYLFEGIWPIPDGTSINAYMVKGEKTAVIDLTQDIADFPKQLLDQMEGSGFEPAKIDYIIVNHMEPDHSGWLRKYRAINPDATIYCTKKAAPLVEQFSGITEGVHAVEDGETLDLGDGKVLTFLEMPNVHWPEVMMTWLDSEGILFACDGFGSYGAVEEAVFDDQCSQEKLDFYEKEALRYYANIVATFSTFVERAIKKAVDAKLDIKMIAPSHGIIWREDPGKIINDYVRYAGYMKGPAEPEITVIYGSMYGNTAEMLNSVVQGIRSEKVPVHIHRVPKADMGFILADAWKSTGLVLGMPTYEYKMFPPMAHVIDDLLRKKVGNKKAFRFGAYGWSGGAQKELEEMTVKAKWDFIEPVEWQGAPTKDDLDEGYKRGQELARTVKEFAGS